MPSRSSKEISPSAGALLSNTQVRSDSKDQKSDRNFLSSTDRSIDFFSKALRRIIIVLTVSTACFFLRVVMLLCKVMALHRHTTITNSGFALFGFWWFVFSDFIPRAVPAFAFMTAMAMSHRHSESDRAYLAKQANLVIDSNFDDVLDPMDDVSSGSQISDEDIVLDLCEAVKRDNQTLSMSMRESADQLASPC